ncbi:minichromosome maintenance protein 5 [Bonamia ostreae]|uniref:DNA replication licensing factor MCM5 n=1 Tax=Bonamia ostreae TaxID=126728 RepID=A0ABV2APF0_9EUKA
MAHVFSEVTSAATYSDQRLGAETSEAFKRNEQIKQDEAICYKFIEEWRKDESFIYRERVKANYRSRKPELTIDFSDLSAFDKSLSDRLAADPNSLLSLLEKAALKVVAETLIPRPKEEDLRPIHIKIENYGRSESIRALRADHINRLVEVNGIVTSAYKVQSKATKIRIKCATCNDARDLACPKGFGSAAVPRVCSSMVNGSSDTLFLFLAKIFCRFFVVFCRN